MNELRPTRDMWEHYDDDKVTTTKYTAMIELQKLLERWTELEPDRCSKGIDLAFGQVYKVHGWLSVNLKGEIDTESDESLLQGAVQQAIEARGWLWGRNPIGGEWQIVIPEEGFATQYWEWISGDSLLAAYLQALEATAEVAG